MSFYSKLIHSLKLFNVTELIKLLFFPFSLITGGADDVVEQETLDSVFTSPPTILFILSYYRNIFFSPKQKFHYLEYISFTFVSVRERELRN